MFWLVVLRIWLQILIYHQNLVILEVGAGAGCSLFPFRVPNNVCYVQQCNEDSEYYGDQIAWKRFLDPKVRVSWSWEQVIKDRKWKEVTNCFKFPDTTTSASYVLRKYYVGLLYYFEQAYFFGKQGALVPPPSMFILMPCSDIHFLCMSTYMYTTRDLRGSYMSGLVLSWCKSWRSSKVFTDWWLDWQYQCPGPVPWVSRERMHH